MSHSDETWTFCSSLRKRRAWTCVVSLLVTSTAPHFRETRIGSHDITISSRETNGRNSAYRFALLSQTELELPETDARIQRLAYLDGGRNVAVIFLLSSEHGFVGMKAFHSFQIKAVEQFHVPVMPLSDTSELVNTLQRFVKGRMSAAVSTSRGMNIVRDLLPYCTTESKLPERTVNYLSDISGSFRDLVVMMATADGRDKLTTLLGEEEVAKILAFFTETV